LIKHFGDILGNMILPDHDFGRRLYKLRSGKNRIQAAKVLLPAGEHMWF
jgi:hypothetical protein